MDGDGTLGYWPMVDATEGAIAKARETGLGMGLARHIGHYGSAGHYTRMCMESGCIGFSVQGYRNMGDARGQDPKPQIGYFGNPPLCRWPGANHGGMVLAIHIETVIPGADFNKEVDRFVKDVRETYEPMPGYDEALLPGAIEEARVALHREQGIRFGEIEQRTVREMSERLDVPLPWSDQD